MGAPAGIELLSEGSWNPGSVSGEWLPGGCGCGSGEPCSCGGLCGCKGEGVGSCGGGKPSGEVPLLPDYDGEIWASSEQSTVDIAVGDHSSNCGSEFCLYAGDEDIFGGDEEPPQVEFPPDTRLLSLTAIQFQEQQDSTKVSICGPDITDWLVRHLVSDVFLGLNPERGIPATNWAPYGKRDLKNIKDVTAGEGDDVCPQYCGWGVTFCGKCVSKDVPGNMGFGGALGKSVASILAGVSEGDEDAADRYAYALGAYAHAAGRRYVKNRARTHPTRLPGEGADEAVKAAVCKVLNDPSRKWPAHFFQDCKPCGKPWPQ